MKKRDFDTIMKIWDEFPSDTRYICSAAWGEWRGSSDRVPKLDEFIVDLAPDSTTTISKETSSSMKGNHVWLHCNYEITGLEDTKLPVEDSIFERPSNTVWDTIPLTYNYIAMDEDGTFYAFKREPFLHRSNPGIWCTNGRSLKINYSMDVEWQQSLQTRPSGVRDWSGKMHDRSEGNDVIIDLMSTLPEDIHYVAMDADLKWHGYHSEPEIEDILNDKKWKSVGEKIPLEFRYDHVAWAFSCITRENVSTENLDINSYVITKSK